VRDCVCRLDVATCDRLAAPNQSEQPEALQEKLARPARWIRYSLRHRAPLLRFVVPSALISRGALAFVGRSRGSRPRELIRLGTSQTVQLETADALWGGSFVTFQVTTLTRLPSSLTCRARVPSENPICFLARSPEIQPCRATRFDNLSTVRSASCTVAIFFRRGVPLRATFLVFRTSTTLPGDGFVPPSLRVSRLAALMGSFVRALRRFAPADG
jgi:hypothetical protein